MPTGNYIAVKVKGLDHWIWFLDEYTTRKQGRFKAHTGWGKGGSNTSIDILESDIVGTMYSDTLGV